MQDDFRKSVMLPLDPSDTSDLITHKIDQWWTSHLEGSSHSTGQVFTVRFNTTFKTMRVQTVIPGRLVEWMCIDQNLDVPEGIKPLRNKREWVGNVIRWEVESSAGDQSKLTLTHVGLSPRVECWAVCEPGWSQTLASILALATTGKGNPFVALDGEHLRRAREHGRQE